MQTLYFLPDTNLFIQCYPLEELDWSKWSEFDEIHLIVCRPVQREIDEQKVRGNERVGKRARQTYSMFRDIIIEEHGCKLIREAHPQVKILIEPSCQPDPALEGRLDYSKTDDQIVGCVHSFRDQNPKSDVRLLTHDSGPMGSAQMLALPFVPIPDDWIRPPESSKIERENKRLQMELATLRKAEPEFEIFFVNNERNELSSLQFEKFIHEPLIENEISAMMESLKKRFPIATEFGLRERIERKSQGLLSALLTKTEVFTPASDQEITEYTDTKYPAWVENCEYILQQLPISLEKKSQPTTFSLSVVNKGIRPGKDALITITAKGNFQIRPPLIEDSGENDSEENVSGKNLSLPLPPTPPEGEWTTLNNILSGRSLASIVSQFDAIIDPNSYQFREPLPLDYSDLRRDPNQFYYKPERSIVPTESFDLECEQWRHGRGAEIFEGELCFDQDSREICGVLECSIHAENLSTPVKKAIRVRGIVTPASVRECANALLNDLFSRAH